MGEQEKCECEKPVLQPQTKHLDNEIERLSLMERTKDLSDYGQDMLDEFRAIKKALNIHDVSI